mmetsp:Transcript_37868/g.87671  ORF Transcript_37868/g.87671 Transcript_37868/m.87671 type:complete len:201 (+) Transcript_37868:1594-2196(+)
MAEVVPCPWCSGISEYAVDIAGRSLRAKAASLIRLSFAAGCHPSKISNSALPDRGSILALEPGNHASSSPILQELNLENFSDPPSVHHCAGLDPGMISVPVSQTHEALVPGIPHCDFPIAQLHDFVSLPSVAVRHRSGTSLLVHSSVTVHSQIGGVEGIEEGHVPVAHVLDHEALPGRVLWHWDLTQATSVNNRSITVAA